MGLFSSHKKELERAKKTADHYHRENQQLKRAHAEKDKMIRELTAVNESLFRDNLILSNLCVEKDECMDTVMSDGLRHGSPEAGRQMAYKSEWKKNQKK